MAAALETASDSGGVILPSSGTMAAGVGSTSACWFPVQLCCWMTLLLLLPPRSISGASGDARLGCTIPDRSMRCYPRVSKALA